MGNVRRTMQNLEIIEIDEERNLIFVKGSVSGHVNSDLILTPATKSKIIDREIFVTLETSSEAQPETPETPEPSSEAQPETAETPEPSSEAQPENSEEKSEPEQENSIDVDGENIEKV